ncbi:15099_t:CDS:1 [Acaulospora colombiana]|uniref:15099_t:CDS:1 n=1 Tax=Acaulospora colombiana TaxID=27376 RepID=A0ACA9LEC4_9GLOM|nr:15099_t:CDS:1 [Acaulospora colombiana]
MPHLRRVRLLYKTLKNRFSTVDGADQQKDKEVIMSEVHSQRATRAFNSQHNAIGSWFLGPQAENFHYLQKLFNNVAEHQMQARKKYFSDDMVRNIDMRTGQKNFFRPDKAHNFIALALNMFTRVSSDITSFRPVSVIPLTPL